MPPPPKKRSQSAQLAATVAAAAAGKPLARSQREAREGVDQLLAEEDNHNELSAASEHETNESGEELEEETGDEQDEIGDEKDETDESDEAETTQPEAPGTTNKEHRQPHINKKRSMVHWVFEKVSRSDGREMHHCQFCISKDTNIPYNKALTSAALEHIKNEHPEYFKKLEKVQKSRQNLKVAVKEILKGLEVHHPDHLNQRQLTQYFVKQKAGNPDQKDGFCQRPAADTWCN